MQGFRRLGFLGLKIGSVWIVFSHQASFKCVEYFCLLAGGGHDLAVWYFGSTLFPEFLVSTEAHKITKSHRFLHRVRSTLKLQSTLDLFYLDLTIPLEQFFKGLILAKLNT